jgi:hypothetical protein
VCSSDLSLSFVSRVGLTTLGQPRLSGALSPTKGTYVVTRSRPYLGMAIT